MKKQSLLLAGVLYLLHFANSQTLNPDNVYPLASNNITQKYNSVNLFTGQINDTFTLAEIKSRTLSYRLQAMYNSATAGLIAKNTSMFASNVLGGYGWKLMDYPKIVQDGNMYFFLDGYAAYPLQMMSSTWAGTYSPAVKWGGGSGTWNPISNLVITDTATVYLNNEQIPNPVFSPGKLSWQWAGHSQASINFQQGCNQSYFFNPATQGNCFTGWFQSGSDGAVDFRGQMQGSSSNTSVYSPGGKYYLWQIKQTRNGTQLQWEIATEDGTHYIFDQAGTSIGSNVSMWSFSKMKEPLWNDVIYFNRAPNGDLTSINTLTQDTFTFAYTTLSGNKMLTGIAHSSAGSPLHTRNILYQSYTLGAKSYSLLSGFKTIAQINSKVTAQNKTGYVFNYYNTMSSAYAGATCPGMLSNIVSPEGGINTFTYQNIQGIYCATQVAVNDGYINYSGDTLDANTYSAIEYDTTNLLKDQSGTYLQINYAEIFPGGRYRSSDSLLKHPYGSIEHYFFNGKPVANLWDVPAGIDTAAATSLTLRGYLYQSLVNSDSLVADKTKEDMANVNFWSVGYLDSSGGQMIRFPKLDKTYNKEYHIGSWITYNYGTRYALVKDIYTTRRNPKPLSPGFNKDSLQTHFVYAFEQYPALSADAIHVLNVPAQTTQFVQEDLTGPFKVTSCGCVQWSMWDSFGNPGQTGVTWAPWKSVEMRDSTAMHNGCFTSGAGGTTKQWLVKNVISKRTPSGAVSDSISANRAAGAALYSAPEFGLLPVATFTNAAVDSTNTGIVPYAAYIGFEPHEKNNQARWSVTGQGAVWGYAHTGEYCLYGDAECTLYLKLNSPRKFIFSGWCRVSGSSQDTAVFSMYDNSGKLLASKTILSGMGNPVWTYVEISATLQPGQFVKALVHTGGMAFVDDLRFAPVDAPFKAFVYDLTYRQLIAQIGDNGETDHYIYNKFGSAIATAGPSSTRQVKALSVPYNSRGGNKIINNTDAFDPVYPNMELQIGAAQGGSWETFQLKGSESFLLPGLTNMSITNGSLVTTAVPASAAYSGNIDTSDFMVYSDVTPLNLTGNQEMGMSFLLDSFNYSGTLTGTYPLLLMASNDSIKLYLNGRVCKSIGLRNFPASSSLLFSVMSGNNVSAYMFGRYLFECTFINCKVRNEVTLVSTNPGGSFDNFVLVNSPDINQQTFDALSRPKQFLERKSVTQLQVSEIMYGGPMNLPLAQTRPGLLGGVGSDVGLSYKAGFASGFRADSMNFDSTAILASAAGYDNPFDVTLQFSESPLPQISSVGGGGEFTVNEKAGNYKTFSYGDSVSNLFNYTSTELLANTETAMDGSQTISLVNKEKAVFGKAYIQKGDTMRSQWEYDNAMRLKRKYLPDFYKTSLAGNTQHFIEYGYDFSGNMISMKTPDAGVTQMVYDLSGSPRFMMYANGAASNPDTIVYRKYDFQQRLTEEGYFIKSWNRDSLQNYADNDHHYPATGDAATIVWKKKYLYDGKGIAPDKGKLTAVYVNSDKDSLAEVKELFKYNASGFVISKGLQVLDFDTLTRYINYRYDDFGRVTQIDFPGTSQNSITYNYNGNGKVDGVGIPGQKNYYAGYSYEYNTIEYLNNNSYMRSYSYNESGWPVQINDPLFNETLAYGQADGDSVNYYNGRIASQSLTQNWNNVSTNGSFTYDNSGRLATANYGTGNSMNLGVVTPVSYDPNGNIQNLQNGTASNMVLNYTAGTNRLQTVQGFAKNFIYDNNGNITGVPYGANSITYDPVSQMTAFIAMKKVTAGFQYNGQDQRVLKTAVTTSGAVTKRLYVHGVNDYPLMEIGQDAAGNRTTTFYVYGPTGLIAIQQGARRLFTLKDHLGSIRAVIDTNNQLRASFTYTPLGVTSSSIDSAIIDIPLNYRFTGQEYDPETQLYNFRARFYDPGYGRFYTTDPMLQFASPYVYAGNNPISNIDPSGTWSFWSTVAVIATSVVATAAVIIAAPVALGAVAVAAAAIGVGTVAGVVAGAIAGKINGDGAGTGALYGLGIGAAASIATVGAAISAAAYGTGGYTLLASIEEGAGAASSWSFINGAGSFTPTVAAAAGKIAIGGAVAAIGGWIGTGIQGSPSTPIDATDDGIGMPIRVTAADFNITTRTIQGYYSIVDLTKLKNVTVPDNSNNINVRCPVSGAAPQLTFPYRVIVKAKNDAKQFANCGCTSANQQTLNRDDWRTFYTNTLWINANFFDITSPGSQPYGVPDGGYCTNIFGVSLSNSKMVSGWPNFAYWGDPAYVKYDLDALVFYKQGKGGDRKADPILFTSLSTSWLNDNVHNAIGGIYFLRNDVFNPTLYQGVVSSGGPEGRTAIGISDDGKKLLILEVDNKITNSPQGVSFAEMATFFRKMGYKNAINLDGNGSSAFFYSKNGVEYSSCPMDNKNTGFTHRPIPNFIGFK
ncbi:MAG: phosphodiester glycosidase family protein [Bacteroidota bacterium]